MDNRKEIDRLVADFVAKEGEERLREILQPKETLESLLTIVCDRTMHPIPEDVLVGTVYDFSTGNLDASSDELLKMQLLDRISRLNEKLRAQKWKKVRIIISGHAILAPQIKMLVYRVLHLETEDFGFFGKEGYRRINIDFRRDLS